MGHALFEATWGGFLRQQAQPGFDLNLLPLAYAHVTTYVRGGGPLPVLRLGCQPYAIAPVMARGGWAPIAANGLEQWLANFLPGIRPLWTSAAVNVPSGPSCLRSSRSPRGCACAPPTSAPPSRTWRRCTAPS